MLRPVVVALVTAVVGMLSVGEVAVAGALGAADDGAAGCVDGGGLQVMPPLFVGWGMGWGNRIRVVAGGTDSEGDLADASVDGTACGGAAEGGVGDALCVGIGGADGVVGDAPVVSAAGDAFSVCEGAAEGGTAAGAAGDGNGVGVVGDGSGREFAHGWSSAWALATPGRGRSGRLWLVGSPVLVVLVASAVWACPRQSWRGVLMVGLVQVTVLSMSVTSAVADVSPGYAEGEVGVGDGRVGGVIGDAAG